MKAVDSKASSLRYKDDFLRIGDLVNFDGPELTIFERSKTGEIFLFDYVDHDAIHNRWLLYQVNAKDVLEFVFKKITHLELFQRATGNRYFFVDLNHQKGFSNIPVLELLNVPSEYFPNAVHFDSIDCPKPAAIESYLMNRISSEKQENRYSDLPTIEIWGNKNLSLTPFNRISSSYFPVAIATNWKMIDKIPKDQYNTWSGISIQKQSKFDAYIYATPIKKNNAYALAG